MIPRWEGSTREEIRGIVEAIWGGYSRLVCRTLVQVV